MRARWVIWIASGVLVLTVAFGILFVRGQSGRFEVRVIGQTNDGAVSYVLLATNGTHRPHAYTAWSEYTISDGVTWRFMTPYRHGTVVPPHGSETFLLLRSTEGRQRRIKVSVFPLNTKSWENWRDWLKALAGVKWSQSYRVYIDAE